MSVPEPWPDTPTLAPDMIPTAARQSRQPRHPTAPTVARQPRQRIIYFPTVTMCVHCQGHPDSPDSPDSPDTRQCSTGPTPPTAASDRGRCKRGPSCPYISAQSPSPRMFLKNLRQRIVQYYIKIEPCHAKVFRPTMVQRHIRDRANADSAVCTPKHQTMLYMSAQSPSPWTFLTNLRQRIVQNYTKIEPGYAKVFRQTTVQRHIRDCVTMSAVPSGRAGSACDLLCWSGALC